MRNVKVCAPEFADAIAYRYGLQKGRILTLNAIVTGQLYGLVQKYGEDLVFTSVGNLVRAAQHRKPDVPRDNLFERN